MKKILLLTLLAASLGATTSAFGQTAGPTGLLPAKQGTTKANRPGAKEMEKINAEILDKLNLTPDQKAKIEAHQKEMAAKIKELRKSEKGAKGSPASDDLKEKVKALRKENQAFLKETLTKDQMKEMVRLRREAIKEYEDKKAGTSTTKP